eukprot:gene30814-38609_t
MTGQKIVDHYVQECGIGISPALDAEAAGAHIQLDPMLLYVVLSNLLTNALKYGDQMVKPQINVKVLMADASDVLPPVAVELWNAPGSNHAEFTENSTRILQARGASTANNFLSDGIGMSTIKMCLKYTSWTMDHQVNSNGTTMRITLPGALVSSRQAAADTDDSSLPSLVDPNGIPSGGDGAGIGEGLHSNQQSQQSAFDEGSAPLQVEDQFPPGVKIAMLDDSMMLRMMYQRQLRKMGVKTFWVEGATETEILGFAKLVMDHDVDIVVLDQNLSEVIGLEVSSHINGCTVMRDLLCMGFSGVCVTRTAYHSPESIEEYLAIGFDDVLSKTEQLIDQLNDNWKHYKTLLVARRAPALTGFYRMCFSQKTQAEMFPQIFSNASAKNNCLNQHSRDRHSWEAAYWQKMTQDGLKAWRDRSFMVSALAGLMLCGVESTRSAALELGGLTALYFVAATAAGGGWMPVEWAPAMIWSLDYAIRAVLVGSAKDKTPALAVMWDVLHALWLLFPSRGPGTQMLSWMWKAVGGIVSALAMAASAAGHGGMQDSHLASRDAAMQQGDS